MSDENAPIDGHDAGEDVKVVNPDPDTSLTSSSTINRAKPRRSKAPVILGVGMAALLAGAVYTVFARGSDGSASRMVNVLRNIDTTPAGQQLAASENYRQSLANSNQQGSQQAAMTPGQSFLATPDEPTRPVEPPKEPIPVVEPKLPPANQRLVEVKEKIVYRDRLISNVANQMPPQPETDWASIDAMAKRMASQSNGLSGSWQVGKSKNTIVIEQELYVDPKGRPTGVQVRAPGSPQTVLDSSGDPRRETRSQRERQATRNPNASPVEAIPQDTSYQADLDTSLPYLSVAPTESEPRLQVDSGRHYGTGAPVFTGDYYAAAGSIAYAVIVNGSDTDTPGPVVAKVMRGPLKGARLLGSFKENRETTAMVVQFDRVVLQDGTNLDAKAYAIDAAKGTLAVKSEYDARLLQRYAPKLAGAFLSGIGRALSQTEQTIVPLGLTGAGIARPKANIEEGLYAGAGEVGDQLANEIEDMGPRGSIVRLNAGKLIGVLFTENVQRF
ncbi:DotG/IcmE/VirB10 family protein [Aureimonas sp. AU12]|uniref:DotG/IcmE/VirB10 family protein n=1 Tax=Aureimonas sp. AU12 TaxID=1638161 RepID=UPI000784A74D|nr:DotG/IcmE/VirB10 family protein [Aureimonas sp. AU12]